MAQTKMFESSFSPTTTEEKALEYIIVENGLVDYFDEDLYNQDGKNFKITITVEEVKECQENVENNS